MPLSTRPHISSTPRMGNSPPLVRQTIPMPDHPSPWRNSSSYPVEAFPGTAWDCRSPSHLTPLPWKPDSYTIIFLLLGLILHRKHTYPMRHCPVPCHLITSLPWRGAVQGPGKAWATFVLQDQQGRPIEVISAGFGPEDHPALFVLPS